MIIILLLNKNKRFQIMKKTNICVSPSFRQLIINPKSHSSNRVLLRKMMKSFIILNILVFVYVGGKEMFPAQPRLSYLYLSKGQSSPRPPNWGEAGECCRRKVVGGRTYRLFERSDEAFDSPNFCTTDCVYMSEGSGVKYCFKPGGLESECFDEGGICQPFHGTLFLGYGYDMFS